MALLDIKKYPDGILKLKAKPVSDFDARRQKLVDDMIETLYAAPGVGLAAPQVGVSERLIVIDTSRSPEEKSELIVLVNPEIVDVEGQIESEEGCLSLPKFTAKIQRYERVFVKALNRDGKEIEIEGKDVLARVLQHEIDHLNGIILLDKVGMIKREFYKKRLRKESQAGR